MSVSSGLHGPSFGGLPEPVIPLVDNTADAGLLAGVPTGAGVEVPSGVAPAALESVADSSCDVATLGDACGQLCDADLDRAVRELFTCRAEIERALVLHVADALQRGIIAASDSGGARQWLTDRTRAVLEPFEVTRVVWAAEAINQRENAGLRRLFLDRELTAAQVATVVREAPKALACLPDADRDQILGYYVYAAQHDCSRRDLRELTRQIVHEHGEGRGAAEEEKAQRAESVTWQHLPGGLWELVAVLSPSHGAQVIEAIQALATPRTHAGGAAMPGQASLPFGATDPTSPAGEPAPGSSSTASVRSGLRDTRSAGQRRADALVEIIGAAARADDRDAARATARVTVTMGLESLLQRLDDSGFAVTDGHRSLDAGAARRLACSAEIIPAVLGTDGAPMDVGRAERTFTGSLRTAIVLRDRQCTFPGCDRPPGWCEGHHIVPWWAGGETAKHNGTLLCSRHHHVVHSRGYLANVTESGVEWDLTPGRMQHLTPTHSG